MLAKWLDDEDEKYKAKESLDHIKSIFDSNELIRYN